MIGGAITLGTNSNISGTFIGDTTVTLSAGSFLNGRATTKSGAVNNSGSISTPTGLSPFPMGVVNRFAIYSSNGALTNTGATVIVGDIGTHLGTITGFDDASISGLIYPPSQVASIVSLSFYVDSVLQLQSTREPTNVVTKEDIVMADEFAVTSGQTVSVKCINSIGISRFYNRIFTLTELPA